MHQSAPKGKGVLPLYCVRQLNASLADSDILLMDSPSPRQLLDHRFNAGRRQDRRPVLLPLTLSHDNLLAFQIHILHSQLAAASQPQASAVHDLRHQAIDASHAGQDFPDLPA